MSAAKTEQRGSIGDTAPLRSGKRYFVPTERGNVTPFRACDIYLRKLGRRNGDLSQRRYFYLGQRYGISIFEAYVLRVDACMTNIHQRMIWQESQKEFVALKKIYRNIVGDCSS